MPRKQKTPFKPSEGFHPYQNNYIRTTDYMIRHKTWISLSAQGKELYHIMRYMAKGKEEFEFSASLASMFGMDGKTFRRARDNLVEFGFIDYLNKLTAKYKRETGKYRFSNKWYEGKTSDLISPWKK